MTRILVTGGTGFIGRRLMRHLIASGAGPDTTCLIKRSGRVDAELLASFDAAGVRMISGDLTDTLPCASPPPDVSVVFHLAANIDTSATETESRVNDLGTDHLLDWLGGHARGARLMFTSSVAVSDRLAPATAPLDETSPCTPRTNYGRTKLAAEQIIRSRQSRDGYRFTILRLPTVYGPGQKRGGMFDLLAGFAAKGSLLGRLNWPGRTSVIYVDDVARMLVDLAAMPETANETFCVATAEALTVGQIAQRIGRATGHPIAAINPPPFLWSAARWFAFNRIIARLVPRSARVAHWRLGLIVADGFWQSAGKLDAIYTAALLTLDEGLRAMLAEAVNLGR